MAPSESLAVAPLEPLTVASSVCLAVTTEPAWQHLPSHPVSSTGPYQPGPSRTVKHCLRRMRALENSTRPSPPHPYVKHLPTRSLEAVSSKQIPVYGRRVAATEMQRRRQRQPNRREPPPPLGAGRLLSGRAERSSGKKRWST